MNRTVARRLLQFLGEDVLDAVRQLYFNTLAGSVLMPRVVRTALLRLGGMQVNTYDLRSRITFAGFTGVLTAKPGSCINHGVYLELVGDISIGTDAGIGTQSTLITSTHPFDEEGHYSQTARGEPIVIGDRVWLAARVTVLPGVTIGSDVIVAAGAVVTKDLAPGGLYAGVPARRLRDLPQGPWTDGQRQNLLRSATQ